MIRNDDIQTWSSAYAQIFHLLAEFEIHLIRERYEDFNQSATKDGGNDIPSFRAFVAQITLEDAWREQIVEKLEAHMDRLAATKPLEIKHVFYAYSGWGGNTWHNLEVNGERGEKSLYEGFASHPDGYIAITDYYSGDVLQGDKAAVPNDGQVWAVIPVPFVEVMTATYDEKRDGDQASEVLMAQWQLADRTYEGVTPSAYDNFAEVQDARKNLQGREAAGEIKLSVSLQDIYFTNHDAWTEAAREAGGIEFREYKEFAGYDAIAAYRADKLHVGTFRKDTGRGVIYARESQSAGTDETSASQP